MSDVIYMHRALELAENGVGVTSPGPMVGAVIINDGRIIGEGFYTYDGLRHAEVTALEKAGARSCRR
jgi:diaminohydroxyphosphoribosylaminopyrimidine deaminase/5-amino-6-(5-phosphoribosylamino)uracil reductase